MVQITISFFAMECLWGAIIEAGTCRDICNSTSEAGRRMPERGERQAKAEMANGHN
jgi:hypothetical protein